jgi:mono/diheme cytochrome c family protein
MHVLATAATVIGMLLGSSACFAEDDTLSALQRDGHALAERMCAQCHAIGRLGASAHSAAPAFRDLDRRIDLDGFTRQLREGLVSGHPDMLTFRFSRDDARALTAYLRAIQE